MVEIYRNKIYKYFPRPFLKSSGTKHSCMSKCLIFIQKIAGTILALTFQNELKWR